MDLSSLCLCCPASSLPSDRVLMSLCAHCMCLIPCAINPWEHLEMFLGERTDPKNIRYSQYQLSTCILFNIGHANMWLDMLICSWPHDTCRVCSACSCYRFFFFFISVIYCYFNIISLHSRSSSYPIGLTHVDSYIKQCWFKTETLHGRRNLCALIRVIKPCIHIVWLYKSYLFYDYVRACVSLNCTSTEKKL